MSALMTSMNAKKHIVRLVFDWDDTLLASFELGQKGYKLDTPLSDIDRETKGQLRKLDQVVVDLLVKSLSLGQVTIITNSETGWVAMSAEKFLPQTYLMLPQLTVVSARSTYELIYPGKPKKWKKLAFIYLLSQFVHPAHAAKTLVGFGDNHIEREALFEATSQVRSIYAKSIKFTENPSAMHIILQLKLVTSTLDYICSHEGKLDLQLTVTANPPMATPAETLNRSFPPPPPPLPSGSPKTEVDPPSYCGTHSDLVINRPVALRPTHPPGFQPIVGLNRAPTPMPALMKSDDIFVEVHEPLVKSYSQVVESNIRDNKK